MRLVLDFERRHAFWDGTQVSLRRREFDVLAVLYLEFSKVVPRQTLTHAVYKDRVQPGSRAIDNQVKRLRRKFPPELIETVYGVGYRLEEDAVPEWAAVLG